MFQQLLEQPTLTLIAVSHVTAFSSDLLPFIINFDFEFDFLGCFENGALKICDPLTCISILELRK